MKFLELKRKLASVDHVIGSLKFKDQQHAQSTSSSSLSLLRSRSAQQPSDFNDGTDGAAVVGASSALSSKRLETLIDTTSVQFGTCPSCFAEMRLSAMRGHVCDANEMVCPEVGCGARFSMKALKKHLAKECQVAKKRRALGQLSIVRKEVEKEKAQAEAAAKVVADALVAAAHRERAAELAASRLDDEEASLPSWAKGEDEEAGPPNPHTLQTHAHAHAHHIVECVACLESLPASHLGQHLARECRLRVVRCPNFRLGCSSLLPLALLQQHLRAHMQLQPPNTTPNTATAGDGGGGVGCPVERKKDAMAARAALRKELVRCVGCGEMCPLQHLRKHEAELCGNRRVPCKNLPLGCPQLVSATSR